MVDDGGMEWSAGVAPEQSFNWNYCWRNFRCYGCVRHHHGPIFLPFPLSQAHQRRLATPMVQLSPFCSDSRYHLFLGPFIWKRDAVPWCPEEQRIVVQNYYRGHLTAEELAARDASLRLFREATELGEQMTAPSPKSVNTLPTPSSDNSTAVPSPISSADTAGGQNSPATPAPNDPPREQNFVNWVRYTAWPKVKEVLLHGVNQDIVYLQQRDSRQNRTRRLEKMHARAAHYDNQTEHLYSFLQVLTAATQSFAHGYINS